MTSLPAGWSMSTLDAVCIEMRNGISVKPTEQDGLPILRISAVRPMKLDVDDVRFLSNEVQGIANYSLNEGDLLFTRYNGNRDLVGACAKVGHIKKNLVYPDKLIRVRIDPRLALPSYVEKAASAYQAREFIDQQLKTSAGQVGISGGDLKRLPIPIAPIAEQKRIVDKLDSVLTRVDAVNTRLACVFPILKRFRQSILAAATSGRLTEDWRGGVQCDWPRRELQKICLSIADGDHQAPPQATSGIPFVTISAFSNGHLDLRKVSRFVPESYFVALDDKRRPQPGDVLYSVTGSIGVPALVATAEPFTFQRHIAILKPDVSQVSSAYLRLVLESSDVYKQALAVATGTAQMTIPLGGLRRIDVPLPASEEQAEIVRRAEILFDFADRLEVHLETAQTAAERLTPALLAKAFRGELVPQDPNDEPATELLRRSQEDRSASMSTRGRRAAE